MMKKCLNLFDNLLKAIIAICTALILILILVQVFARLFFTSPTWIDEVCRIMFVATIFFGAALCVKEKRHVKVDILNTILPPKASLVMEIVAEVLVVVISVFLVYSGYKLGMRNMTQLLPATSVPKGVVYMFIPVAAVFMVMNSLRNLIAEIQALFCKNKERNEI